MLALIGVAFIILAVWLYKSTRVDLSLLAPLETMSDRKWRRLDPASQRRLLDDERGPVLTLCYIGGAGFVLLSFGLLIVGSALAGLLLAEFGGRFGR